MKFERRKRLENCQKYEYKIFTLEENKEINESFHNILLPTLYETFWFLRNVSTHPDSRKSKHFLLYFSDWYGQIIRKDDRLIGRYKEREGRKLFTNNSWSIDVCRLYRNALNMRTHSFIIYLLNLGLTITDIDPSYPLTPYQPNPPHHQSLLKGVFHHRSDCRLGK